MVSVLTLCWLHALILLTLWQTETEMLFLSVTICFLKMILKINSQSLQV